MPPTTSCKFGDVVLLPFPFTDQSASKKRPAVVINSEEYDRRRPDVIVMAITSQIKSTPAFGEVHLTDWKKTGLLKPGVIKPIIATTEKTLILKKLGRLPASDEKALRHALTLILD